jgi:hypothetical protein
VRDGDFLDYRCQRAVLSRCQGSQWRVRFRDDVVLLVELAQSDLLEEGVEFDLIYHWFVLCDGEDAFEIRYAEIGDADFFCKA